MASRFLMLLGVLWCVLASCGFGKTYDVSDPNGLAIESETFSGGVLVNVGIQVLSTSQIKLDNVTINWGADKFGMQFPGARTSNPTVLLKDSTFVGGISINCADVRGGQNIIFENIIVNNTVTIKDCWFAGPSQQFKVSGYAFSTTSLLVQYGFQQDGGGYTGGAEGLFEKMDMRTRALEKYNGALLFFNELEVAANSSIILKNNLLIVPEIATRGKSLVMGKGKFAAGTSFVIDKSNIITSPDIAISTAAAFSPKMKDLYFDFTNIEAELVLSVSGMYRIFPMYFPPMLNNRTIKGSLLLSLVCPIPAGVDKVLLQNIIVKGEMRIHYYNSKDCQAPLYIDNLVTNGAELQKSFFGSNYGGVFTNWFINDRDHQSSTALYSKETNLDNATVLFENVTVFEDGLDGKGAVMFAYSEVKNTGRWLLKNFNASFSDEGTTVCDSRAVTLRYLKISTGGKMEIQNSTLFGCKIGLEAEDNCQFEDADSLMIDREQLSRISSGHPRYDPQDSYDFDIRPLLHPELLQKLLPYHHTRGGWGLTIDWEFCCRGSNAETSPFCLYGINITSIAANGGYINGDFRVSGSSAAVSKFLQPNSQHCSAVPKLTIANLESLKLTLSNFVMNCTTLVIRNVSIVDPFFNSSDETEHRGGSESLDIERSIFSNFSALITEVKVHCKARSERIGTLQCHGLRFVQSEFLLNTIWQITGNSFLHAEHDRWAGAGENFICIFSHCQFKNAEFMKDFVNVTRLTPKYADTASFMLPQEEWDMTASQRYNKQDFPRFVFRKNRIVASTGCFQFSSTPMGFYPYFIDLDREQRALMQCGDNKAVSDPFGKDLLLNVPASRPEPITFPSHIQALLPNNSSGTALGGLSVYLGGHMIGSSPDKAYCTGKDDTLLMENLYMPSSPILLIDLYCIKNVILRNMTINFLKIDMKRRLGTHANNLCTLTIHLSNIRFNRAAALKSTRLRISVDVPHPVFIVLEEIDIFSDDDREDAAASLNVGCEPSFSGVAVVCAPVSIAIRKSSFVSQRGIPFQLSKRNAGGAYIVPMISLVVEASKFHGKLPIHVVPEDNFVGRFFACEITTSTTDRSIYYVASANHSIELTDCIVAPYVQLSLLDDTNMMIRNLTFLRNDTEKTIIGGGMDSSDTSLQSKRKIWCSQTLKGKLTSTNLPKPSILITEECPDPACVEEVDCAEMKFVCEYSNGTLSFDQNVAKNAAPGSPECISACKCDVALLHWPLPYTSFCFKSAATKPYTPSLHERFAVPQATVLVPSRRSLSALPECAVLPLMETEPPVTTTEPEPSTLSAVTNVTTVESTTALAATDLSTTDQAASTNTVPSLGASDSQTTQSATETQTTLPPKVNLSSSPVPSTTVNATRPPEATRTLLLNETEAPQIVNHTTELPTPQPKTVTVSVRDTLERQISKGATVAVEGAGVAGVATASMLSPTLALQGSRSAQAGRLVTCGFNLGDQGGEGEVDEPYLELPLQINAWGSNSYEKKLNGILLWHSILIWIPCVASCWLLYSAPRSSSSSSRTPETTSTSTATKEPHRLPKKLLGAVWCATTAYLTSNITRLSIVAFNENLAVAAVIGGLTVLVCSLFIPCLFLVRHFGSVYGDASTSKQSKEALRADDNEDSSENGSSSSSSSSETTSQGSSSSPSSSEKTKKRKSADAEEAEKRKIRFVDKPGGKRGFVTIFGPFFDGSRDDSMAARTAFMVEMVTACVFGLAVGISGTNTACLPSAIAIVVATILYLAYLLWIHPMASQLEEWTLRIIAFLQVVFGILCAVTVGADNPDTREKALLYVAYVSVAINIFSFFAIAVIAAWYLIRFSRRNILATQKEMQQLQTAVTQGNKDSSSSSSSSDDDSDSEEEMKTARKPALEEDRGTQNPLDQPLLSVPEQAV